ncbi:MAG: class I SAM-dependent methyltransferase [Chloroflexi bacterium]|nr:class I SAM-dependent methyltransferase [Chloroflexota bacterium]
MTHAELRTAASDRHRLRLTFGVDAERYDRVRPAYPAKLFDDLAELACIGPGCRVLEIGLGTGQATIPIAERGCQLTGVELSPELAAVAQRKLAAFSNASIVVAAFEDWPLPVEPFDAVVSATAFHWIDPAVRVTKAADALRPGGVLATIDTHHVAGGSADFFVEVQDCYERWDPATPAGLRLSRADDIPSSSEELDRSGRFAAAAFRRYEWEVPYSTVEYCDLLRTYSGHIALESAAREGLLDCIGDLIDTRYGSRITKRYLTELRLAERR